MERIYDIPLSVPDLRGREREYLVACVDENWVSTAGPFVDEVEQRLAELTGRQHAVATSSGTAALHLALIAAEVGPGDQVIIPDWTFSATANAVIHAGATPILADITRSSWTLDPALVEQALSARKPDDPRIGAVIPVHALGHPAEMDPLVEICAAHGVPLIEDAAGAIGALYKGRKIGSLGDSAMFSFNGNKTVTAGGGGAIVTDNPKWADAMRLFSVNSHAPHYKYATVGFNYRMTNLSAAVCQAQLQRLDEMLACKKRIAETYDAAFAERTDIHPMPREPWVESNFWMYTILCGSTADAQSLVDYMEPRKIQVRIFWRALSSEPPYRKFPRVHTSVCESISGRVVAIPCSSGLSPDDQARVIEALSNWRGESAVDAA